MPGSSMRAIKVLLMLPRPTDSLSMVKKWGIVDWGQANVFISRMGVSISPSIATHFFAKMAAPGGWEP